MRGHDPEGKATVRDLMPDLVFCGDAYEAVEGTDAVVMTEWDAFRTLDFARPKRTMTAPVPVDLRNVYRREQVEAAGFAYTAVGR